MRVSSPMSDHIFQNHSDITVENLIRELEQLLVHNYKEGSPFTKEHEAVLDVINEVRVGTALLAYLRVFNQLGPKDDVMGREKLQRWWSRMHMAFSFLGERSEERRVG